MKIKDVEDIEASASLTIHADVEFWEFKEMFDYYGDGEITTDELEEELREWLFDDIYEEMKYAVRYNSSLFDDVKFDIKIKTKRDD